MCPVTLLSHHRLWCLRRLTIITFNSVGRITFDRYDIWREKWTVVVKPLSESISNSGVALYNKQNIWQSDRWIRTDKRDTKLEDIRSIMNRNLNIVWSKDHCFLEENWDDLSRIIFIITINISVDDDNGYSSLFIVNT